MDQQQTNTQPTPQQLPKLNKHFKSFWPIVIIAVVSALLGGLIVWLSYNMALNDEVNSLIPMAHVQNKNSPFYHGGSKESTTTPIGQTQTLQNANQADYQPTSATSTK